MVPVQLDLGRVQQCMELGLGRKLLHWMDHSLAEIC